MPNANITDEARQLAQAARRAAPLIGAADTRRKNAALAAFAENLLAAAGDIRAANAQDITAAEKNDLPAALRERLTFGEAQIAAAVAGVRQIIAQNDPIGAIDDYRVMPSGIQVGKMRAPLGVLLMIYESRPNVTADAAALALKAGNAILLRGGSEALRTNTIIGDCLRRALMQHELPDAAQLITNPARELVGELLQLNDLIDLVIPRGGQGLTARVAQEAKMPALYHLEGNCHVYIDAGADVERAARIVENAKTRRYGVCNAAESLLIHRDIADAALPALAAALQKHSVELRVCAESRAILEKTAQQAGVNIADVKDAQESDWSREYLAPIISVKVVADLCEAITHINRYGSAHTDAIISNNTDACRRFMREVDSSSVIVNASTGFADGGEYGLGAEIGISTGRLHARGPVGALGLTTQKYIVIGDGNCRA